MDKEELKKKILKGEVFIYPTDTIYGLGCNALDKNSVDKIKEIKKREKHKPMSIIAPSKKWIRENCYDPYHSINKYLPGPYTLILKKKKSGFLKHVSHNDALRIRIPENDFCKMIQKANVPFITTSVNLSSEKPYTNIKEIPNKIKEKVDIIIDKGIIDNPPSTIILEGKEIKR